ncbi:glycosyltransferase family 2 protein [Thiocystis violascens]|uniref:Putative glycosyltransferase n=1 Tax=Thiocystis violascens (strain ATCC 17096 / DSM 198 / 6111) TaxID=765911 RepID=I3YFV8_THIV6|nr:glycosyltransferase [Thiocystis violascens]AFL75876.1 putative glycosyltransferase [Thiocystis violascens DSM 198]
MNNNPLLTVALCTHNHVDRLERTLANIAGIQQPRSSWEFLVVDNGSRDFTPEFLRQRIWPEDWSVRVVCEEKLGIAHARNRAIAEAHGEYLIFLDDDENADSEWLRAYEKLIAEHRPDAFGGRIEVLFEDLRPRWLTDELLGFLGKLDWSEQIKPLTDSSTPLYTGNFGFRRAIVETIGLFDASLGRRGQENNGGEDVDFYRRILRAGLQVWWMPEAVIYHRIQAAKLKRSYFLDLHYRQGRMEAIRKRGQGPRIPPPYLFGQLMRAVRAVWSQWRHSGRDATLRKEMNVAYFGGQILGWAFGPRS